MATTTSGTFKITFTYDGKNYTTSVYRRHGVATFPKYVINFKSGSRHLTRLPNSDTLTVTFGDPLSEDLLNAIMIAVNDQIESTIDHQEAAAMGYSVHPDYLK